MPLELVIGLAPDSWIMKSMNRVLALATWAMPTLFGYQFVFVARSAR
jgi:hypothetical protein